MNVSLHRALRAQKVPEVLARTCDPFVAQCVLMDVRVSRKRHEKDCLMKTLIWSVASVVISLGLVGCSTSNDGGSSVATSVDSNRAVATLSDAELVQYCKDLQSYTAARVDLKKAGCVTAGSMAAAFATGSDEEKKAACKAATDRCMNAPAPADGGASATISEDGDCAKFANNAKGCNAQVGELNRCVEDSVPALQKLTESRCDQVGAALDADAGAASEKGEPPSCVEVNKKCPDL